MGTPAQNFAGPPRVVEFARLKIVLTNYPLRTELVRLKTTLSNKKILHERRTFLLAGAAGFEPTNVGTKSRCLTTWRRPNNMWSLTTCIYINQKKYKRKCFFEFYSQDLKIIYFCQCCFILPQLFFTLSPNLFLVLRRKTLT